MTFQGKPLILIFNNYFHSSNTLIAVASPCPFHQQAFVASGYIVKGAYLKGRRRALQN